MSASTTIFGARNFGRRHLGRGHRSTRRSLSSCTRHGLYAHADVLLDDAGLQSDDRRRLPNPHGDAGHAAARPLPRLPLFHQRGRRQCDDVHESLWAWGHPEVYILVLPAFGIYSEVVSTFSGKPLFGYRSMVAATMVICILSFMVWLHHFFTMGAGGDINPIFGIASMIIAVPTGVKTSIGSLPCTAAGLFIPPRCCGRSALWSHS